MTTASTNQEVALQRDYYRRTAAQYDHAHVREQGEHDFALAFLLSMAGFLEVRSALDIGSGTGRALLRMKSAYPGIRVVGVEPSPELREVGYSKGLAQEELVGGDAQKLTYPDGSFDLVCEFGALHHIPDPSRAVAEMLRVASKAVFISDSNNFGQGSRVSRGMKQMLRALALWPLANYVKTRGKGYSISEGDGLYYSYSVFTDYPQIARQCGKVHLVNTTAAGVNPYRSAPHIALLGVK